MITVILLDELNGYLESIGIKPVATGPIFCEMQKIKLSRNEYNKHPLETRMHFFIVKFDSQNRWSLVRYPCGYHNDHYYNK